MSSKKFNDAILLLQEGRYQEGKKILEKLNRQTPNDYDILYNLGMAHSELGELKSAIKCLKRCISINPNYSNAYVALGMACFKRGEEKDAEQYFERALIIEPENPFANKNIGSLYGNLGNYEKAIDCFNKALKHLPDDIQLHFGFGQVYTKLHDSKQARHHFDKVIKIAPDTQLSELARKEINKIGQSEIKAPSQEIVDICINALTYFDKIGVDEMQKVVAEIALLGDTGLDYEKKYTLSSLKGEFTGLELITYMFVGLQEIAPGENAGVDFSNEYQEALNKYNG